MKKDVLTCQENATSSLKGNSVVTVTPKFKTYSKSYKNLDPQNTENVMKSGDLYFDSKCVVTPSNFDYMLENDFYSFGTSNVGGLHFVSIFEHKKLPIFANVFLS